MESVELETKVLVKLELQIKESIILLLSEAATRHIGLERNLFLILNSNKLIRVLLANMFNLPD